VTPTATTDQKIHGDAELSGFRGTFDDLMFVLRKDEADYAPRDS